MTTELVHIPAPARTGETTPRTIRLPRFIGLDQSIDAGARIGRLRVGIVGLGAIGRYLAKHLVRLQPARLVLVDHGRYKAENLDTQDIMPDDIDQPKAGSTGRWAKAVHPNIEVVAFDGPAQELPEDTFSDCHYVLMATDNLPAEIEIGRRCAALGIPLLHTSVYGDALVSQIRFFRNDGTACCPMCNFGRAEWRATSKGVQFTCQPPDGNPAAPKVNTTPTFSVSALSSLAAEYAILMILCDHLGLGKRMSDCLIEYCAYTQQTITSELTRNEQCPGEHQPMRRFMLDRPIAQHSLMELVRVAGQQTDEHPAHSWAIDRYRFSSEVICACGKVTSFQRFVEPGRAIGTCPACEQSITVGLFNSHRPVTYGEIMLVRNRPLRDLGVRDARYAIVKSCSQAAILSH